VLGLPRLLQVLSPAHAGKVMGKKVLLLGHTLGPLDRPGARRLARHMLAGTDLAVVRERRSVDVALSLGIREVEEAPDMAFALRPTATVRSRAMVARLPVDPRRTLVFSVRSHPTAGPEADSRLVQAFADAGRRLVEGGIADCIAVVPHTVGPTPIEDDRPLSRALIEALDGVSTVLVDEDATPGELSSFYGEVGAVVAVRLHAGILALAAGTPTFAVSYLTGKTQGVMTQVGLGEFVADFQTVTADELSDGVTRLMGVEMLRERLLRDADARRQELMHAARAWLSAVDDLGPVFSG